MTDDARRLRPVLAAFAGGAAAWLIAFGASLALAAGFRVMGVEDDRITGIVSRHFTGDAVRFLAFTAVAHLAFGLWFAVPVAALKKPSFGLAFFFALGASLALLGYGAGYRPALYSSWLYDRGGPAALVHVFLTRNPVAALALVLPAAAVVVARAVKSRDAVALFALILSLTGAGAMVFYRPPSRPVAAPASADKPDLVILAADSLRPDRLACYGGKRAVTPNISALCDGATMFEEAFVPTARTFPSWASILTGQPPWVHGVRNMFPDPERATLEEALPRRLALAGYETAVFSDYAGDVFPRMDAGFDIVHAPPFDFRTLVYIELLTAQKFLLPFIDTALGRRHVPLIDASAEASDARHLTDRVLAYLARPTTKPRLVVVFYSTTHFPFAVPYPDVDRFTAPDYFGPFRFEKQAALGEEKITPSDRKQIAALFDTCAYAVDREIGRLVSHLRAAPGGDRTVVVVTADHGENLYEDGGDLGHGDHFRGNRTMHVPLIVDAPAFFPQRLRVTGLVSTMDIAPTLEAIAGAEPGPGLAGVDLRVAARDGVSPHKDLVFETGLWFAPVSTGYLEGRRIPYPDITELGEIDFDAGTGISIKSEYFDITNIAKHRMLYTGRYKLLYLPTGRGIKWELYDLLYDAGESMDISGESRALTRRLARRLLDALAAAPNTEIRNDFILPLEPAD